MHFFEFVNYVFTCKIQSTYLNSIPFKRFFFFNINEINILYFSGGDKKAQVTALVGILLVLPHITVFGIFGQPLQTRTRHALGCS